MRVCRVLGTIVLAGLGTVAWAGHEKPTLPAGFADKKAVSFRVWGSHSNFTPSCDGRLLYFGENGPDGMVLKSADLTTGEVTIVKKMEADIIAAVPGDPMHLVVATGHYFPSYPFQLVVVDLRDGHLTPIPMDEDGCNGKMDVSPGGRYVIAETGLDCPNGEPPCSAAEVAVYSIESGAKTLSVHRACDDSQAAPHGEEPGGGEGGSGRCVAGYRASWDDHDVLRIDRLDGKPPRYLRPTSNGKWVQTSTWSAAPALIATAHPPDAPGTAENLFEFKDTGTGSATLVPVASMLPGCNPAYATAFLMPDRAIALCETLGGLWQWNRVDAVSFIRKHPGPETR